VAARRRCDGADRFGCSAGRTACVMQRWGLRCLLTAVVGMSPGHKHLRQHVIAGEALRGDSFPAQHDVAFKNTATGVVGSKEDVYHYRPSVPREQMAKLFHGVPGFVQQARERASRASVLRLKPGLWVLAA